MHAKAVMLVGLGQEDIILQAERETRVKVSEDRPWMRDSRIPRRQPKGCTN